MSIIVYVPIGIYSSEKMYLSMNETSILMPKLKIYMHALKRCDVLRKVKFNITKEVFIVL